MVYVVSHYRAISRLTKTKMPISEQLDKAGFDALPETHKALYSEGKDGAFILDVVPRAQGDAANKKANDDAAAKLAAFEGIDPAKARELIKREQEKEAAALAEKDKDGSIRSERAAAKAATEQAKKEAEDKIKSAQEKFDARAIKIEVGALAKLSGVLPDAIEDVIALAQKAGFTSDEDGDLVGPKGLKPDAWLKDLLAKKTYLVGTSEGGNTPPRSGKTPTAGLKKSNMTAAQKGEFLAKHGAQAFRDLPQ